MIPDADKLARYADLANRVEELHDENMALRQQLANALAANEQNLKVYRAAAEVLRQQLAEARRTAEYWKAEHLAGNEQLAAALAACKQKDTQLSRAREGWMTRNDDLVLDAITNARAIQPDDSALWAWLGEPVGWYNGKDGEYGYDTVTLFEDIAIGSNLYKPKGIK